MILNKVRKITTMSTEVFGAQKVKSVVDGQLSEIAPVLKKHDIKLIGVGVNETGVTEFVDGKFFDGELYHVENLSTYNTLGFKKFNNFSILTSLFWKQSRDAISKGRKMGLSGDAKGDWGQVGGALLVGKGGQLYKQFQQTGPADHLPNLEILKFFGLENEYKAETMANKDKEDIKCDINSKPGNAQ